VQQDLTSKEEEVLPSSVDPTRLPVPLREARTSAEKREREDGEHAPEL
jgi:hypothetical protein